ncbi:hypothetical protein [Comamonas thiooxydans]|uniref:hypothetical protein n=1 Tax=Comamonas thiooxydans TaxID=363952 RepID=UPI0011863063|nr:hypothetical protein [Comamonas thiooxydans]
MKMKISALAILFGAFTIPAFAQDVTGGESANSMSLWVTSGFVSKHLDSRKEPKRRGYNESNEGFGAELQLNRNWGVVLGTYENSYYATTRYVQGVWMPDATRTFIGPVAVKLGLAAGVVDGYAKRNHGDWTPAVMPVLSFEWKNLGANILFAPSTRGSDPVIALQFKIKAF